MENITQDQLNNFNAYYARNATIEDMEALSAMGIIFRGTYSGQYYGCSYDIAKYFDKKKERENAQRQTVS